MYIGKIREPVTVIILTVVTCGIYGLYWFYTMMQDMNGALGEERIQSTLFLVLSIVCAPVIWYVMYQLDKGTMEACAKEGVEYKENFILWLLLSFVLGVGTFVCIYQLQSAYNKIWEKRGNASNA